MRVSASRCYGAVQCGGIHTRGKYIDGLVVSSGTFVCGRLVLDSRSVDVCNRSHIGLNPCRRLGGEASSGAVSDWAVAREIAC